MWESSCPKTMIPVIPMAPSPISIFYQRRIGILDVGITRRLIATVRREGGGNMHSPRTALDASHDGSRRRHARRRADALLPISIGAVLLLTGCSLGGSGTQAAVLDSYSGNLEWVDLDSEDSETEPTGLIASGTVLRTYSSEAGLSALGPVALDGDWIYVDVSSERFSAIDRSQRGSDEVSTVFDTAGSISEAVLLGDQRLVVSEFVNSEQACYLVEGDERPRELARGDQCAFSEDFSQVYEVNRAGDVADVTILSMDGEPISGFTAIGLGESDFVVRTPMLNAFGYTETLGPGISSGSEFDTETSDTSAQIASSSVGYLVGSDGQELGITDPMANLETRVSGGGIAYLGDVDGESFVYAGSSGQLRLMGQGESGWVGISSNGEAAVAVVAREGSGQIIWAPPGGEPQQVGNNLIVDLDTTRLALVDDVLFISTGLGRSSLYAVDMLSGSVVDLQGVTPEGTMSYAMRVDGSRFLLGSDDPSRGSVGFLANTDSATVDSLGPIEGSPIGQIEAKVILSDGQSVRLLDLDSPARPGVLFRSPLASNLIFSNDGQLFASVLSPSSSSGSGTDGSAFVETEVVSASLEENVRETTLRRFSLLVAMDGITPLAEPSIAYAETLRASVSRSQAELRQDAAAQVGCVGQIKVFAGEAADGQVTLAPSECFFTTSIGPFSVSVRSASPPLESQDPAEVTFASYEGEAYGTYRYACVSASDETGWFGSSCESSPAAIAATDGSLGVFILNSSSETAVVDLRATLPQ